MSSKYLKKIFKELNTKASERIFDDFLSGMFEDAESCGLTASGTRVKYGPHYGVERPLYTAIDIHFEVFGGTVPDNDIRDKFGNKIARELERQGENIDPDEFSHWRLTFAYGILTDIQHATGIPDNPELALVVYGTEMSSSANQNDISISPWQVAIDEKGSSRVFAFSSSLKYKDKKPAEIAKSMVKEITDQLFADDPNLKCVPGTEDVSSITMTL